MKLNSIQSLRAVAALLVMVYHTRAIELDAMLRNGLAEPALVSVIIENGYAGVDLFFVISGYLITGSSFNFLDVPLWILKAGE